MQTGCLGRIGEIHFSIVEIDAGFAALIIVAAPVNGKINKAIAVEIRRMHVDLIPCRRDLQVAARLEVSLAVTELERDSRPFVQPIHIAVAIQINQGVRAPLASDDVRLAKIRSARRRLAPD